MPKNELTERERIVLQYYLLSGEKTSPIDIYRAAYDGSLEKFGALVDPYAAASRWIRSKRVLEYLNGQRSVIKARREAERAALEEEIVAGMNTPERVTKRQIDYYDPANQKRQINRIIAQSSDDPKTQLDAIKAIQQTQRDDKQAAREGKTVRAYLPLSCDICPLYKMGGDVLKYRANEYSETQKRAIVEKYVNKLLNK